MFLIALGVIVVLSVFLLTQRSVQSSTGREIGAMALGARAQLACESCLSEASYGLQSQGVEGTPGDPAFRALRDFDPDEQLSPEVESLYTGETEYLRELPYRSRLTREAYADEEDVRLGAGRAALVSRRGFPGEGDLDTRDHEGVLALEQEVTVTPPYGGFSMAVTARHLRAYRAVHVGVPPPFDRYAVILDDTPGDDNPLRRYWRHYQAARRRWIAQGRSEADLEDFPVARVEEGDGRFWVTRQRSLSSPDAWNVDALATEPGTLGTSWVSDLNGALAVLATAGWERPGREEEERLRAHAALLTTEALANRTVFRVETMADLAGYFGDGELLYLDGIVRCEGPLLLDNRFEGDAVLWTPSPEGVRIRSLAAGGGDRLVVVATRGDIEVEAEPGAVLHASLLAPQGTIRGLEGVHVHGHLWMRRLPPGGVGDGPVVEAPPRAALETEEGGLDEEALRDSLRVYFDPGVVRKDSRRRRVTK